MSDYNPSIPPKKRPFSLQEAVPDKIAQLPNVRSVQACASKAGIIQTDETVYN